MQHFIYASFTAQVSGVCQPKYETVQTLKSFSGKHCWQRRRKQWKEAAERKDILKVVSLWADDGISNAIFLKHAKCHFSLEGFDFSHCLSAQSGLRDDHSITCRLWILSVYPEGSPAIALFSATPSKTWWALLSVFLSRRGVSPLYPPHTTTKRCCISPWHAGVRDKGRQRTCHVSFGDFTQTKVFFHTTCLWKLRLYFPIYHLTNFQDLSVHSV